MAAHGTSEARPAFRFESPFAPQQCADAIAEGQRLQSENASPRAHLLLAEGYLCRGLQDDPWALESAIEHFHLVLAEEPRNFFAQLELSDALRMRFSLSPAAEQETQRALALLARSDVGAARERLTAYIVENLAAMQEQRARVGVAAAAAEGRLANGIIARDQIAEVVGLLVQTGPRAAAFAATVLARRAEADPGDWTAVLYQAEAVRGLAPVGEVRTLYVRVAARSCGARGSRARESGNDVHARDRAAACALARLRLTQISARNAREN